MKSKRKNSIATPGYFIKRLKDNGFFVYKIFDKYHSTDYRKWTIIVDPGGKSIFITCFTNKAFPDTQIFEMWDGIQRISKNFYIKTDSLEVIITYLLKKEVPNKMSTLTTSGAVYN